MRQQHFRSGVALAVLALATTAAQERSGKEKEFPPPAVAEADLPAAALKFGVALLEQAPADLKKWAESHARSEMRSKPVDPQGTMAVVDARYMQEPDTTRDAITFLVFYLAYKDEDENYRTLGYRIRDIDRETKEITRELQVIWKNQDNRSASPLQAQSQQARVAQEEEIQRKESQLRDFADERQMKGTLMTAARKKVSVYLKLLKVVHERMRGTDPALLRSVSGD
jgi:hypothetical protein